MDFFCFEAYFLPASGGVKSKGRELQACTGRNYWNREVGNRVWSSMAQIGAVVCAPVCRSGCSTANASISMQALKMRRAVGYGAGLRSQSILALVRCATRQISAMVG